MDNPAPLSLLLLLAVLMMHTVRTECGLTSIRFDPKFRSLGHRGQRHYFHHQVALNWHAANRTCHRYQNTHLVTIPDEETFYFLTVRTAPWWKLDDKGSFWFGAHEVKFDEWRWQNDETYLEEVQEYHRGTKNSCGLVDGGTSPQLAADTCTLKKRFLCTKSDVDSTNLGTDDYYISTTAEAVTWYEAKQICWSRGMELAMSKNKSTTYIYGLLNGSPDHFWIGLQKARYVWESTREAIHYLPFQNGEPNDYASTEDCLHVKQNGYNDRACRGTSSFICEWENRTIEPPVAPPTMASKFQKVVGPTKKEPEVKRQEEETGEAGITVAVTLSVLAVVAVIALTLALVVQRANNGNTGNRWLRFRGENTGEEGM